MRIFFIVIILQFFFINNHAQTWNPVAYNNFGGGFAFGIYQNKLVITSAYVDERVVTWDEANVDTVMFGNNATPNCFLEYNNKLLIGGEFSLITAYVDTFPYYVPIPYTYGIAQWDENNTSGFFTNENVDISRINALTLYNDDLYAAGQLNNIYGINMHHIAKWDGNEWSNPGGGIGLGNTEIKAMVVYNDELYIGGRFFSAGGIPSLNIARWNGTIWDSVSTWGLGYIVNAMVVDTTNNYLYVGGAFTVPGAIKSSNIARWDGTKWDSLGMGCPYDVMALEMFDGKLYASVVENTGLSTDTVLMAWNGQEWEYLIGFEGFSINIYALKEYRGNLYVGGLFRKVPGGDSINYIACYGNNCPDPLSINEQTNKIGFKIYPNPNTGQITIEWEPLTAADFITITTIEGKETERIKITRQENKISLSTASWAKGIYFFSLFEGTRKLAGQKIVVE